MKTYNKIIHETKECPLLSIEYSEDIDSPREWSNAGYFVIAGDRYNSPDKNEYLEGAIKECKANTLEQHIQNIKNELSENFDEKVLEVLPVAKYEHGNVQYYLSDTVPNGFDSGICGFYIITAQSWKENVGGKYTREKAEKIIAGELEIYTQWCNGEVYSYTFYNLNGEIVDSCCEFYGLNHIKEHLPAEWKNEDLQDYLN